jgi:glycerophosphoryl diester phosphodiesterase
MKWLCPILFWLVAVPALAQVYIPTFDLQGHRGGRGLWPENSIGGFLNAIDSGVTTIELDLVITKDKQVVVSHDPWMSSAICRQPDGSAIDKQDEKKFNIYEMDYAEVRQFDCGSIRHPDYPEQVPVSSFKPLLRDVIVAVERHIKSYSLYEVDYNIEIKSSPSGDGKFHPSPEVFSDLVYNLIDQYLPLERVVIQSFDFRVLRYWHEKYPHIRLSALVSDARSVEAHLKELGFEPSIYSPNYRFLSREKVDYAKSKKMRVIPWTVNDVSDMRRMLEWRVDGFITDYPNRAKSLGLGIRKYPVTRPR